MTSRSGRRSEGLWLDDVRGVDDGISCRDVDAGDRLCARGVMSARETISGLLIVLGMAAIALGFLTLVNGVEAQGSSNDGSRLTPDEAYAALFGNDPHRHEQYDRKEWKHWIDQDKDCKDTRAEVLVRASERQLHRSDFYSKRMCRVRSGSWNDPYTGLMYNDSRRLDIDHLVPLANAHRSGGYQWTKDRKEAYANYLGNSHHLVAVSKSANRSKGSKGPEDWTPDEYNLRKLEIETNHNCRYAADWISVKQYWGLQYSLDEMTALGKILSACREDHDG